MGWSFKTGSTVLRLWITYAGSTFSYLLSLVEGGWNFVTPYMVESPINSGTSARTAPRQPAWIWDFTHYVLVIVTVHIGHNKIRNELPR